MRRVVTGAGLTLVGLGVLTLLFAAYQLWGTGVWEAHSQDALRHDLSGRLQGGPATTAPAAGAAATAPTTTSSLPPGRPSSASSPPREGGAVGIIRIPKIGVDT